MRGSRCGAIVLGLMVASVATLGAQVTTQIRVRVVSHDAKIIGSGVGGARVTVREPGSGRVLAEAVQQGGTGDTRSLIVEPPVRGANAYDTPGAAAVSFELPLNEPTVLEFVAEGPLGFPQAVQRASKTMLLVPGEHILGDGILLEIHGFIIELLEPGTLSPGGVETGVRVRVRMACGCPLEPGGLWDAGRVRVEARLVRGAAVVAAAVLSYGGEQNIFVGRLSVADARSGDRLVVVSMDAARANFGQSNTLDVR